MKTLIKLNDGAVLPQNAHDSDTGYDLISASDPLIVGDKEGDNLWKRIDYIEYDTNISVAPEIRKCFISPDGSVTGYNPAYDVYGYFLVYPRSSLSKTNLILANHVAIIDNSYRGTIKMRFRYIFQPCDLVLVNRRIYQSIDQTRIYHKGDKIAQVVGAWKENIDWTVVDSLDETKRGTGGYGSTGR